MLRLADKADLAQILNLQAQCYPSIEPEDEAAYSNKLEIAPDCAFVITDKEEVQAYLFALPIRINQPPALNANDILISPTANCLYLHDLAVHPKARGKQLTQPLLSAFFAARSAKKLPYASLIAIQNSSSFWEKYGFLSSEWTIEPTIREQLLSYGEATYLTQAFN